MSTSFLPPTLISADFIIPGSADARRSSPITRLSYWHRQWRGRCRWRHSSRATPNLSWCAQSSIHYQQIYRWLQWSSCAQDGVNSGPIQQETPPRWGQEHERNSNDWFFPSFLILNNLLTISTYITQSKSLLIYLIFLEIFESIFSTPLTTHDPP